MNGASAAGAKADRARKLLVSDVDGTLLQSSVGLSPAVVEAAAAFVAQGHVFTLCTGRSVEGVRHIAEALPIEAPCLLLTGSVFYDFRQEAVSRVIPLEPSFLELLAQLMERFPQMAVQMFTPQATYTLRRNAILLEKGLPQERQAGLTPLKALHGLPLCKCMLIDEDREQLRRAQAQILSFDGGRGATLFQADFASRHFFEVVSHQAGKRQALERLCGDLGVAPCHVFVAGDGLTDLPMFEAAALSFAPEDAIPAVRDAADRLFPPAREDGIIRVFEQLMSED